jgi:hypothetical protein
MIMNTLSKIEGIVLRGLNMPEYKKYPKRTEYNKEIGEGANFLFDSPNICVSVAWYGASFDGKYKITFAWRANANVKVDFPDYPFVRTKRDKAKVTKFIQSNCEHKYEIRRRGIG